MKQLDKYRALVDRIRRCHQMEIDAFEVIEALNDLIKEVDSQRKIIQSLTTAYTDEVTKEREWRPF